MSPGHSCAILLVALLFLSPARQSRAQAPAVAPRPDAIDVKLTQFRPPSKDEKQLVEQWLLELDLVPMIADRIAFTATGTFFLAGKGREEHVSNLRQFAIGWSLDHRADRERLLLINQRLLNPNVIDQGRWRLMQSDTSQIDQLRIESNYHEANGSSVYGPSPKTQLLESLRSLNAFFPTRAATTTPVACWSGDAMDRAKPTVTIEKLSGIQKLANHTVALFENRPADFYDFYISLAFRDGSPVQCDAWRAFRNKKAQAAESSDKDEIKKEREQLMSSAKHVAIVQSEWKQLETHAVPVYIHGVTLDDVYEVELMADIEWFVNDQVNPESLQSENVGHLGPFSVVR